MMEHIHFTEAGSGPPLVLLHGFCETSAVWKDLQEKLADAYTVLCPDLPGWGHSPLPGSPFLLQDISDRIRNWLVKERGIERCILIGHSMGGYIALGIASKYPALLQGFGLFHSTAFADSDERMENRNKTLAFVKKRGVEAFVESFVPTMFPPGRRKALASEIAFIKNIAGSTSLETFIAYTKAMRDRKQHLYILEQFERPVLFFAGEEDSFTDPEQVSRQISLLKEPYVMVMPETGHMGMFERKEEVLTFFRHYLDETWKIPQKKAE